MAGDSLVWWQTIVSSALGGVLTLVGQTRVKKIETQSQREARELTRTEEVHDQRVAYEVARLEELRTALLEASQVAVDGRRARRARTQVAAMASFTVIDQMMFGPINTKKAALFEPRMAALRGVVVVTLDDTVRGKAEEAYARLNGDDSVPASALDDALSALGDRLRTVQGKAR